MADRFVLKQFAGSATNNGAFGAAQATGAGVQPVANIKDVQSLNAFEQGWNAATLTADKLPALEEMQGLEALLCKALKENYSEGIPFWIAGETYFQYSFVNYNGVLYYNTTGSYTNNNPAIDTANWAAYNKVGTATVGTDDTPIYLNLGLPTEGKRMGVVAYDNTKTYNLDDVVLNVDSNGTVELYLSLAASNTSALTDTTKWEKLVQNAELFNAKANTDASNFTATGKETVVGWGVPDYSNRETRSSDITYTATEAGVFYGYSRLHEGNRAWVTINGVHQSRYAGAYDVSTNPSNGSFYFEVGVGDTYSATISTGAAYFAPFKGV